VQNPWMVLRASIGESDLPQSCFTPLHVLCDMISLIKQFSHDEFLTIRTPRRAGVVSDGLRLTLHDNVRLV
jgi:hypothetical protein